MLPQNQDAPSIGDRNHLEAQIEELRGRVRRQRLWNFAPLAVLVPLVLLGMVNQPTDINCDKLRVRMITLVDPNDRARLIAQCGEDGTAGVGWIDSRGTPRIMIDTFGAGDAQITIVDTAKKIRLMAKSMADGSTGIGWLDREGNVRMSATTHADGSIGLPNYDLTPQKKP